MTGSFDTQFPSTEDILSALISIPTVNGNELPAAQLLGNLLTGLGMDVSIQDVGENRANVFAHIGNGETLLFCGHLDVVPAIGDWKTPPFILTEDQGIFYGRGCADMKGAIAAMVSAVYRFLRSDELLNKEIALLFVADEEKDNLGAKYFISQKRPDINYTIIGEPTEMQIAVAHKGVARFRITIHGKSAHSSVADEGINALEGAALLIEAIKRENHKFRHIQHQILPSPSINVTVLHAGEQDNIIPGEAWMIVDYRIFPGIEEDEALKTMEVIVESVRESNPLFNFSIYRHSFLSGGEISKDDPFVERCCSVAKMCFRDERIPREFRATCEQSLFIDAGIKTVICGPGSITQAHTVNEYLNQSQLIDAEQFYYELIRSFNNSWEE